MDIENRLIKNTDFFNKQKLFDFHFHILCRLTPSQQCGPFRGLNNTFSVVGIWIDGMEDIPGSKGAIWIYDNVIRSEIAYFLGTLIIL